MAETLQAKNIVPGEDNTARAFKVVVEVVPPPGPDPGTILADLEAISTLPFDSFSVATNPVARPHMSALAMAALIQQHTGTATILHCTTRDHNWLSLQGLLWGAKALGIQTVLAATGDNIGLQSAGPTTSVRDVDVFGLVNLARAAGLMTGVVFDPRPESGRLEYELQRLQHKVDSGAQFVVTQPVYDEQGVMALRHAMRHIDIPVMLGILPLASARHARFLNDRVSGIAVPRHIRKRMERAPDPASEGVANARDMLTLARRSFAGAFIMPPFDRYELLREIL